MVVTRHQAGARPGGCRITSRRPAGLAEGERVRVGIPTLVIRAAGLAEGDRVRVGTLTLDPSRPGGNSQESKNRHAVERTQNGRSEENEERKQNERFDILARDLQPQSERETDRELRCDSHKTRATLRARQAPHLAQDTCHTTRKTRTTSRESHARFHSRKTSAIPLARPCE